MVASLFCWLLIVFKCTEEIAMLVRLYASEILLEKITIEDVPSKLRPKVEAYLEEMGY